MSPYAVVSTGKVCKTRLGAVNSFTFNELKDLLRSDSVEDKVFGCIGFSFYPLVVAGYYAPLPDDVIEF